MDQQFSFVQTINSATLLTKPSMASLFFQMSAEITEFRRLQKWCSLNQGGALVASNIRSNLSHLCRGCRVHEKDGCSKLILVAEKLSMRCLQCDVPSSVSSCCPSTPTLGAASRVARCFTGPRLQHCRRANAGEKTPRRVSRARSDRT